MSMKTKAKVQKLLKIAIVYHFIFLKPTSAQNQITITNASNALNKVNKLSGNLARGFFVPVFAGLDVYVAPEVTDCSALTESSAGG